MKRIVVFVEGEFDEKIIHSLGLGPEVAVARGPGKTGLKAYMQGFAAGGSVISGSPYVGFRDRDFDYPIPEIEELIVPERDKGKILVSYRTTIENYLLLPENLKFLQNADKQSRWGKLTPKVFEDALRNAALEIKNYQAARHALGETRTENRLETSWLDRSGELPTDLSESACFHSAWSLISDHQRKSLDITDRPSFEQKFHSWLAKFDDAFFERQGYLKHFQGKDLAASLQRQLSDLLPPFPLKIFYKEALKNFDYTMFPDLVQLRDRLKASN